MIIDRQYEDLLAHVTSTGKAKGDRTGTGTTSVFGANLRYALWKGFPLITTKKVHLKSIITELLWFLRGDSNVQWLQENGCTIWDEWALPQDAVKQIPLTSYRRAILAAEKQGVSIVEMQNLLNLRDRTETDGGLRYLLELGIPSYGEVVTRSKGDLGPVYGVQWRSWPAPNGDSIDQIQEVINTLKANPDSRRIIVSAWNVAELDKMALHPCHAFFQFYSEPLTNSERRERAGISFDASDEELNELGIPSRALSCQLYQRSADLFLGVPFNIASYALLTHMIAQQTEHLVGDFIWTGGDCHIYSNHHEQVQTQLSRTPYPFPTLNLRPRPSINDYCWEDFVVNGYEHHPAIKAPVAK